MPKGGRRRAVKVGTVQKKGRALKERLVADVQEAVQTYEHVYVFLPENVRNNSMRMLRMDWKPTSRFFLGKNKVMQVALGRNEEDAFRPDLHQVSTYLTGLCGLLFTNQRPEEVEDFLHSYRELHEARAGFVATREFVLPEGPINNNEWPSSMEPQLRKLGLPTRLVNGVIRLESETVVCSPGDELTPEQCRILSLFKVSMAPFRLRLLCRWSASDKKCVELDSHFSDDDESSQLADYQERRERIAAGAAEAAAAEAGEDDEEDVASGDFDEDDDVEQDSDDEDVSDVDEDDE